MPVVEFATARINAAIRTMTRVMMRILLIMLESLPTIIQTGVNVKM